MLFADVAPPLPPTPVPPWPFFGCSAFVAFCFIVLWTFAGWRGRRQGRSAS